MDEDLRNGLWNVFYSSFEDGWDELFLYEDDNLLEMARRLWKDFFKKTIDTLPEEVNRTRGKIKDYFFNAYWYEVYDFIEFVANYSYNINNFTGRCNDTLEREVSGYRLVEGVLTPIIDGVEIEEVEQAINSNRVQYAKVHLKNALGLLSDRNNPDYRNSIKESISAVEAVARLILNDTNAELGKALSKIEREYDLEIHGALKDGFRSIYGYTSDSGGIRHAMTDSSNVPFEDAKFMLVACSAFVNYLVSKAELTD
ncbi:hypothetical protein J2S77_001733 [Alkalibacillus salilacus]|uniref:HEPN AbiJ-N-terminal domain-containing protein n=2 Tax=Alkalibacillus salilacus TaxID=284582 RepID=A0ABT9VFJ8_9BACI|nr:hypothetical protein [Alkalibacillus salilacus]